MTAAPRDSDAWWDLACALSSAGDKRQAIEAARQAAEFSPDKPHRRYGVALLLAQLGMHGEAIAEAQLALHRSSDRQFEAQVWSFIGNRYWDLGDMRRSKQAYESAAKHDPASPGGFLGLGVVAGELGDWKEARLQFKRALVVAKRPRDRAKAHCGIGMALEMSGDLAGARREYDASLMAYPGLKDAQDGLKRVGR